MLHHVITQAPMLLFQDKLKDLCDGVDEAICLIAAVIHDVDHPGKNRFDWFSF